VVLLLAECDLEREGMDAVEDAVAREDLACDERRAYHYLVLTHLGSERNLFPPFTVSRWSTADFSLSPLAFIRRRLAAIRRIHEVGTGPETTAKKDELLDTPAASEVNGNERAKKGGMSLAGGEKNVVVVGSKSRWIWTLRWSGTLNTRNRATRKSANLLP